MKIGVVSDTHGHVELTRPAVRMLREFGVELVLHCGDIGSGDVVRQFAGLPTHFVFGNCDYDRAQLRDAIEAEGQTCHEEFGEIEVGEVSFSRVRIALLHSHDQKKFRGAIQSGGYDLVCYGHTHVAAIDHHSPAGGTSTIVLNPGAVYRANPHSVAVVEIDAAKPPTITAEIVTL